MESFISDLRQQYATSTASAVVSQAMLLHALNQTTRQVASRISASQKMQSCPPVNLLDQVDDEQPTVPSADNAPLDLSVRSQTTTTTNQRSRSHCRLSKQHQQRPSDLFNKRKLYANSSSNNNNNNNNSDIGGSQLNQSKLITSSTSPTSSGSTTSSATSSEPACFKLRDSNNNNNNKNDNQFESPTLAHELISSTNGRRQRNRRHQAEGKKHKGAKCHLCNFCGRSFSRSDMLTRHSRLHSGLKPYQCGKCYQVFSRSDHLSTHERTHTGEKPYQCQYCDYSACRRDMITRHMRTHSASQDGELEIRLNSRSGRRRKTTDKAKDSTTISDRINEEDDVATSFEIGVA